MDPRILVDGVTSQAWTEVAHGARLYNHVLRAAPDPSPTSSFAQINALYPFEKASDWHRSYLAAALDHLVVWADLAAPLKFHPEQEVAFTFRPAHTLARAAMESASQAVWMTSGQTAEECVRRHLSLIRWDYEEHRKSRADLEFKRRIGEMDARLLERVSGAFAESDLRPPSLLAVLRDVAPVVGLDPDEVESVWRAASGAAHGKTWTALALQHVIPLDEYEPGYFRTLRLPDAQQMTRVLKIANMVTAHGVLRHADFCQADIAQMTEQARLWLASVVPLRDDADPAVVAHLKRTSDRLDGQPNTGSA